MIYDIPDWAFFLPSFTFTNSAQNLFHTCILLAALHYHCHAPLLSPASLPPNAKANKKKKEKKKDSICLSCTRELSVALIMHTESELWRTNFCCHRIPFE